eukprot:CAMPEP_0196598046 /NCGR_PEP_ID=MMETSP1081-20130531/94089_1 /TAXON_ID=36882 /ORGANISM="Pyramimonas amylifera, Strain CCMP720" /LENGTH=280 /DNA_ID=CAMNT_0041923673 /DNA_START=79 /DNA_END=921 /DNA_ORIENTATION=+
MKELKLEAAFQTSLENVLEVFYGDDSSFVKGYHREVNKDEAVTIGPWDERKARIVTFTPNMPMPAVIKRAIGMEGDGVQVREEQLLRYTPGTSSALLTSVSIPDIKGGDRFKTLIEIQFTAVDQTCKAIIIVKISAEVWGVTGMLEKFMADQAAAAFQNFVQFAHQWFAAASVRPGPLPHVPSTHSEMDQFFDAVESGEMPHEMSLEIYDTFRDNGSRESKGEAGGGAPQALTVDNWFMHSVMRDLSELRVAAGSMRSSALANELHLQRLQLDVERLRIK